VLAADRNVAVVRTRTPSGVAWKIHSWMPVIPPAVPPHRIRSWPVTAETVEVTGKSKLLQLNEAPGSIGPSRWASVMSVCHVVQPLTSV
jgi:hypothetical protein